MRRFRFTLIAICLLLLFLGGSDLNTLFHNRQPLPVDISSLATGEPPQEWLTVRGGLLDLTEAINMSGSIEIDSFLVPLKRDRQDEAPRVIVETRDPQIIDTLTSYYFKLDSATAQQQYLQQHPERFYLQRDVTGMIAGGLVATGNRDKLVSLAKKLGMQVPDNVIFLSEGKQPVKWRGWFYTLIGLIGLAKIITANRKQPKP